MSASLLEWMSERIRYFIVRSPPRCRRPGSASARAILRATSSGARRRRVDRRVGQAVGGFPLGEAARPLSHDSRPAVDCRRAGMRRQQRLEVAAQPHRASAPRGALSRVSGSREGAAAGRDHARPSSARGLARPLALLLAGSRPRPAPGRCSRDAPARALLDPARPGRRKPQPSRAASSAADACVLPAAHEADEHDARSRGSGTRSRRAAGALGELGERDRDALAVLDLGLASCAASAATASAIAMRWSPWERTARRASGAPPCDGEAVRPLLDPDAHARQPLGRARRCGRSP